MLEFVDPPRLHYQGWWSWSYNPSPCLLSQELPRFLEIQIVKEVDFKFTNVVFTWIHHGLLDGLWIFPWPLLDLLVHLCDLLLVHGPQAALPLVGSVGRGFLDLLKTFVQRQIVTNWVLPATGRCLEVRKVFTERGKRIRIVENIWSEHENISEQFLSLSGRVEARLVVETSQKPLKPVPCFKEIVQTADWRVERYFRGI